MILPFSALLGQDRTILLLESCMLDPIRNTVMHYNCNYCIFHDSSARLNGGVKLPFAQLRISILWIQWTPSAGEDGVRDPRV